MGEIFNSSTWAAPHLSVTQDSPEASTMTFHLKG